jgi:hypothetical protein
MSYDSNGINIILYPRSYNKRGDESGHSVFGVTDDGTEICVRLKISEQYKDNDWTPSIAEFSREDFRAKMVCVARQDNSKSNREGVLLFSSATPVFSANKQNTGIQTYIAKWAHVLSEGRHTPEPVFAIARVEINSDSTAVRKIREDIRFIGDDPSKEDEIKQLNEMALDPKNFLYSAIMYHNEGLVTIPSERSNLVSVVSEMLDVKRADGIINGFMIRKVDQNGFVIKGSCREFFTFYLRSKERNQNGLEFLERNGSKLDDHGYLDGDHRLEIMPISKIQGSKVASNYYGSPENFKRLIKISGDEENKRACRSVVKSNATSGNSVILNRVFPLSSLSGNPELLSKEGLFNKCYVGEKIKLANSTPSSEELVERPTGELVFSETPVFRAEWLFSSVDHHTETNEDYRDDDLAGDGDGVACEDSINEYLDDESFNKTEDETISNEALEKIQNVNDEIIFVEHNLPEDKSTLTASNPVVINEIESVLTNEHNNEAEAINNDSSVNDNTAQSEQDVINNKDEDEDLFSAECITVNQNQKKSDRRWVFNTSAHDDIKNKESNNDTNECKKSPEVKSIETQSGQEHQKPEKVRGMAAFIRRK